MKNKFPKYASREQSIKIWNLIRGYDIDVPNNAEVVPATVGDMFIYLPHEITFNGHRGDLAITSVDISYFSVGASWEHVLVHFESIPISGDIYDSFIKILEWLKENNLLKTYNDR